jgi:hypothetical protein
MPVKPSLRTPQANDGHHSNDDEGDPKPGRHVILSLGACRLYDEPTRIRNVRALTLRWERLALGRARTRSRARTHAMHARARVKVLVSRRVRARGVALASVGLRFGEPRGRLLLLL